MHKTYDSLKNPVQKKRLFMLIHASHCHYNEGSLYLNLLDLHTVSSFQVRKSNEGELVNGIDSLGIEDDSHLLSSSLEAEQR